VSPRCQVAHQACHLAAAVNSPWCGAQIAPHQRLICPLNHHGTHDRPNGYRSDSYHWKSLGQSRSSPASKTQRRQRSSRTLRRPREHRPRASRHRRHAPHHKPPIRARRIRLFSSPSRHGCRVVHAPTDTLSCHRHTEDTPNIALSLTVPTRSAHRHGDLRWQPCLMGPGSRASTHQKDGLYFYTRRAGSAAGRGAGSGLGNSQQQS
jgi:hypothetical protein